MPPTRDTSDFNFSRGPGGRVMPGVGLFRMVGTKQKYEIAYLLASFLRAGETYDSSRLDEFIARSISPDILGRRGYSPDHLRRCMIDNGFLRREPDGSRYWVAESFANPVEEERKAEEERQNLLLRGAGEEKAVCPYCGERYSGGVLLRHYEKKHSSDKGYWARRVEEYFRRH